tara:strand:- start:707 stop:988 length:282 start_codon:yes stop_codon:yes gene_type:complete
MRGNALGTCAAEDALSKIGFPNSNHFLYRTPLILVIYCAAVDFDDSFVKKTKRSRGASLGCVFVGPASEMTAMRQPEKNPLRTPTKSSQIHEE